MEPFARTEFEQELWELVQRQPAPGKHSARSAMHHIERAWALAEMDPEMAAFRAITAEEEAATSVFHAIRRHKYPGSERLKPWSHPQKNALWPFVEAVGALFSVANEILELNPQIVVNSESAKPKLEVWFNIKKVAPERGVSAAPNPPLDFTISQASGPLHDFGAELENLAKSKERNSILEYVKHRANMRNRLLYASPQGIPKVSSLNDFLPTQRTIVRVHVALFLLIDPHAKHQEFVQQCIAAFLRMLEILPSESAFQ